MKKLLNFRPILFIAYFLCLGILTYYFVYLKNTLLFLLTIFLSIIPVVLYLIYSYKNKNIIKSIIFSVLFIVFFFFGVIGISVTFNNYVNADIKEGQYLIEGRVDYIKEKEDYFFIKLTNCQIKGKENKKLNYNFFVSVQGKTDIDIGNVICFNGNVENYGLFYENKLSSNNISDKIKYFTSISSDEIVVIDNSPNIFQSVNKFIRDSLKSGLDEDEFSVAYGLLCGNKEFMDDELIASFRLSGVAHIFAVSGLHIGFLATALGFLFKKIKTNKYVSIVISVFVLFFYSGVCGFSSSSIRATVMCAVLLTANLIGKRYDPISTVSLAMVLILLFSSIELFSIGFLLSFFVVYGIILCSKPFSKLFKFLPNKISNALGVLLSSQLFGIPIMLYAFNEFSLFSLIANLIFIPFVGVLYVLLFIMTIVGGIFSVSNITLFIFNYLIKGINFIISVIDYKYFIISGFTFGIFSIFYYLTLIIPSGIFNIKRLTKTILCITFALICVLGVSIKTVIEMNKTKICVTYTNSISATVVYNKERTDLVVSSLNEIVSLRNIESAINRFNLSKIDGLIILGDNKDDVSFNLINSLIRKIEIKNVYLTVNDEDKLNVFKSSLKGVNFNNLFSFVNKNYCVILDGYGVTYNVGNKNIIILSRLNNKIENLDFKNVKCPDILVCFDYVNEINSILKSKKSITYVKTENYNNAQNYGNFIYNI